MCVLECPSPVELPKREEWPVSASSYFSSGPASPHAIVRPCAYSSHRERRIQSKLNSESGEAERSSKR